MNIVIINHYAGAPSLGMEYRHWYLANGFQHKGHAVTIIAASFSHVRTLQPQIKKNIEQQIIEGVSFIWIKTPKYTGNGLGRLLNIFSFVNTLLFNKKYFSKLLKPDIVIASSTYPLDIFPAYAIAKKNKAKLIFEVHDLWPLSPMELGGFSKYHPLILLMQYAENYAYKRANNVVSILPHTLNHMLAHGLNPKKFNYIPNGINIAEWQKPHPMPEEHKKIIEICKSEKKIIVGYAGTIGTANELDTLLESAKNLLQFPITIIIVGQGNYKDQLIQKAYSLNLTNVLFLPPVPKKSIPQLLSNFDILYIGWKRLSLYRFGISPNKLFDYMMAGKPIIHAVEAANDAVAECNCGISIKPESPTMLTEAILKLISMTETDRITMGINAKEYVIKNHDYSILSNKFLNIFNN